MYEDVICIRLPERRCSVEGGEHDSSYMLKLRWLVMLMLTPVVGSGERGRWTVSAGRGLILASVPGCAAINDARWLWCHAQRTQLHGDKLGIDMNGVQSSVGVETK